MIDGGARGGRRSRDAVRGAAGGVAGLVAGALAAVVGGDGVNRMRFTPEDGRAALQRLFHADPSGSMPYLRISGKKILGTL